MDSPADNDPAATEALFERLRRGVTTTSAAATQRLAAQLATVLPADATLALHGNLGVGKTTLVQGLARGFGILTPVTSPTFTIYHTYRAPRDHAAGSSKPRTLIHLDAYRIDHPKQVEDLLLEDFLVPPWCLAVEWPEKIAGWLPPDALHLELGITPAEEHTIKLRSPHA